MATPRKDPADGHGSQCGAERGGRPPCGQPAGWGTKHPGIGRCKLHGGNTPTHEAYAQRVVARDEVDRLGLSIEIDPHEALIAELQRAVGAEAYLGDIVRGLQREELTGQVGSFKSAYPRAVPSVWISMWHEERRMAREAAEACLKAGVEERRVRVIEQGAAFAAQAIRHVLERLGHRLDDPAVEEAVRSGLRVVDGEAA